MAPNGSSTSALVHEALFYDDRDTYLAGTVAFIRDGLDNGDAVLVVVDRHKLGLIRDSLGDAGSAVESADMVDVGRNPARIIPVWREFLDRHTATGRSVRGIGEPIWATRSGVELRECHLHEALLNVAFAAGPAWRLLCPYDAGTLSPETLSEARRTHPFVQVGDRRVSSGDFDSERSYVALLGEPLPLPPAEHVAVEFDSRSLRDARAMVHDVCTSAGMPSGRVDEIVLAISEITTNSVMHGGGSGIARVWVEERSVVCEVTDTGQIVDPLVGRRRPTSGGVGGRGLWLANTLCDLVQIRTGAAGTVVRLHCAR